MQYGLTGRCGALLAGAVLLVACASGNSQNLGPGGGGTTTATGGQGGGGASTTSTSSASTSSTSTSSTSTSSTSSATGTGGGGGGGSGGSDGGGPPPGLGLGTSCTQDSDCASMLCKPVVVGTGQPVCVTPCTQQSDCGTSGSSFFCEPITAGSTSGYCIPHSPAHCLSCKTNADCGALSEVCFQAPNDNELSCNIDCSIAGAAACPPDYTCTAETVNGTARQLCRPTSVATCLDAVGGYCDRLATPQPCVRANGAGSCNGERNCLPSKRFDVCGAASPQCKTDCSIQDPAGCTETYCTAATSTPTSCGTCGHVCPGYQKTADNVTCDATQTCTFSCQGENYDVNKNPADGCEVPDAPTGNHTKSTAADEGQVSDCDGNNNNEFSFGGQLPSDKQVHETPAIVGFDPASGSAPDWYKIDGVGHVTCQNNIVMQLCVTGSSSPGCYKLSVIPDSGNDFSCQTDSTGCCPDAGCGMGICGTGSGQFSDDTEIYLEIQKTCGTTVTENVSYTVHGHL